MTRMRPIRRLLLPLLALLALAGCVSPWPGIGQTSVSVIPRTDGQYGGPSSNVTTGPDGALYLVQRTGLVRRDPINQGGPGSTTLIPLQGSCQQVGRLILGPDGALWGTSVGCPTGDILRITTAGAVRIFALTTHRTGTPSALTVGPDNNLWTAIGTTIYRLTPSGAVNAFPHVGGPVTSLATGPDHALWFTLSNGLRGPNLGRITVFGIQLFPTPGGPISPSTLVAGPDGAMWFGTLLGTYGKITTAGVLTTYGTVNGTLVFADAVATRDAVWLAAVNGTAVRIVPFLGATAYQLAPDQHSKPILINGITAARDGSVWLSSSVVDTQLYRVATAGSLQSTVAVRGHDGGLWVQHNMDGHWISLGGGLLSRPSVFAVDGTDYYVVQGNNGHPYVRTDTLGWQQMSSSVMCSLPVARIWNNLLTLACGTSKLYSTPLPEPGLLPILPASTATFPLYKPKGAVGTPALLDGSGSYLAWATSINGAPGPTYTNLFGPYRPTALQCASPPTGQRSQGTLYLACVNAAHQLQYVTSAGLLAWSAVHTVLTTTGVGSPGLIAIPDGTVSAVLVNLDGTVSESRLTPLISSFHSSLGGGAQPDIAATGP